MTKIRNQQNTAIIELISNKRPSGQEIQSLLQKQFSAIFEEKTSPFKAKKLFVRSSINARYAKFLSDTLGLDAVYFDPKNFNNNNLTALIHIDPNNARLWVFLKSCIPSPPLPAEESYKNHIELISYIKDGAFGNKDRALLAYSLVEKIYRLAKTNYAIKEQLDDEFSSKGILGRWLRGSGYIDELTDLSSDASYKIDIADPKEKVNAWKKKQMEILSADPNKVQFIHALKEIADTEHSTFEQLEHLNQQITDLMGYKLGLSRAEKDFLAKFQLELRRFLSLQSHLQIAKLFEDPDTSPEQLLESIQASYDALLGGGGYDVFLLRMVSQNTQLRALYNKHEDAIALQLKRQTNEHFSEYKKLQAAFEEVNAAFTESSQEKDLTALFSSDNRIVTELKKGNYEHQLRARPALKQFIENNCNAERLDVLQIIAELKSIPFSTDSLSQQQSWLVGGIPSTSAKAHQHLAQRELHFKRIDHRVASNLVQRFGRLTTIADNQPKIKDAEAIALQRLNQQNGLTKTNQALRLLIDTNPQLEGADPNQYVASILEKAYPSIFTHLREVDPDIAYALGISRFDKKLSIDLTRFNPNQLNKLYKKTLDPLWLVLKIMVNPTDKIPTCHYLAQCFQEGAFGESLQYEPVLSLIRIANDNASPDQHALLEECFGPQSSIGAWLMRKAVSDKTFAAAEDIMTLLSPRLRVQLSEPSLESPRTEAVDEVLTSASSESQLHDDDRSSSSMNQAGAPAPVDSMKAIQTHKKPKEMIFEQNTSIIAFIQKPERVNGFNLQRLLTDKFNHIFEQDAEQLSVCSSIDPNYASLVKRALGLDKTLFDPRKFNNSSLTALIHTDPNNARLWIFLKSCIPSPPLPVEESYKNHMELISSIKDGVFGRSDRAWLAYHVVQKIYRLAETNYALQEQLADELSSKGILGKWLRSNGYEKELTELSKDASYKTNRVVSSVAPPIKKTINVWKRRQLELSAGNTDTQKLIHSLVDVAETEQSTFEELEHLNQQITDLIGYKLGLSRAEKDFLATVQLELRRYLSLQSHRQIAKPFENSNTDPEQMLHTLKASYDALLSAGGYGVFLTRLISYKSSLNDIHHKYQETIDKKLNPKRLMLREEAMELHRAKMAMLQATSRGELVRLFQSNNRIIEELKAGNYNSSLKTRPELDHFIGNNCGIEGLSDDAFAKVIAQLNDLPIDTDAFAQQQRWLEGGIPETSVKAHEHLKRISDGADSLAQRFGRLITIASNHEKTKEMETIALEHLNQQNGLTKTNQALRLLIGLKHHTLLHPDSLEAVQQNQYVASILQKVYPSLFARLRKIDPDIAYALGISRFDKKFSIDLTRFNPNQLNKLYNKTRDPLWLVLKIMVNPTDKIKTCHHLAQCFQDGAFGERLQYEPVLSLIRIANDNAGRDQHTLLEQFFGPKSTIGAWLINKAVSEKISRVYDSPQEVMKLLSPSLRARLSLSAAHGGLPQAQAPRGVADAAHQTKVTPLNGQTMVRLQMLFTTLSQREGTKNSSLVKKVVELLNSGASLKIMQEVMQSMAKERKDRYLSKFSGLGFHARNKHIVQPLYALIAKEGSAFKIDEAFCASMEKLVDPIPSTSELAVKAHQALNNLTLSCQQHCKRHTGIKLIQAQLINASKDPNACLLAIQELAKNRVNSSWSKSHFFAAGRDQFVQKLYVILSRYDTQNPEATIDALNTLFAGNSSHANVVKKQ